MAALTKNQQFHLVLADIAMAMAVSTCDPDYPIDYDPGEPAGSLRDRWLAQVTDRLLRQRVTALASAGLASLQAMDPTVLSEKAARYGITLPEGVAETIAEHFENRRSAVLTYRR